MKRIPFTLFIGVMLGWGLMGCGPGKEKAEEPEAVAFGGLEHTPIGGAKLETDGERLTVIRTRTEGVFGVAINIERLDSIDFFFEPMKLPPEATFTSTFKGGAAREMKSAALGFGSAAQDAQPQTVASFRHTGGTDATRLEMRLGSVPLVRDSVTVQCIRNGDVVNEFRMPVDPQASTEVAAYNTPGKSCHWVCTCGEGGLCTKMVDWDTEQPGQLRFPGDPQTYTCDYLRIEFDLAGEMLCPGTAEFTASGIPSFVETRVRY
jgi:hypothetical protein